MCFFLHFCHNIWSFKIKLILKFILKLFSNWIVKGTINAIFNWNFHSFNEYSKTSFSFSTLQNGKIIHFVTIILVASSVCLMQSFDLFVAVNVDCMFLICFKRSIRCIHCIPKAAMAPKKKRKNVLVYHKIPKIEFIQIGEKIILRMHYRRSRKKTETKIFRHLSKITEIEWSFANVSDWSFINKWKEKWIHSKTLKGKSKCVFPQINKNDNNIREREKERAKYANKTTANII